MNALRTDPKMLTAEAAADRPDAPPMTGLSMGVARTMDEVVEAWSLVHDSYVRAGLIDPKPEGIHTVPQAAGPQAAVIVGRLGDVTVATMTAILDNPAGLPLDTVYKTELDAMRADGRRLMELGLFADRRERIGRSLTAILELMRYVFHFGMVNQRTDGVIGVHPRHAAFYTKYFSFRIAGRETTYATVKDRPVILLRLDWQKLLAQEPKPMGLAYFLEHRIAQESFAERFLWSGGEEGCLAGRAGPHDTQGQD